MMNVPRDVADQMSLHDYEEMLYHWNEAHDTDVKPPDAEKTMKQLDRINKDKRLTH